MKPTRTEIDELARWNQEQQSHFYSGFVWKWEDLAPVDRKKQLQIAGSILEGKYKRGRKEKSNG